MKICHIVAVDELIDIFSLEKIFLKGIIMAQFLNIKH